MLMETPSCVVIQLNLTHRKIFHSHYKCFQWFSPPWWLVHIPNPHVGGGVVVLKQQGTLQSDGPDLVCHLQSPGTSNLSFLICQHVETAVIIFFSQAHYFPTVVTQSDSHRPTTQLPKPEN